MPRTTTTTTTTTDHTIASRRDGPMGARSGGPAGLWLALGLLGCGQQALPPPSYAGDTAAEPAVSNLPSADGVAFTEQMRFGMTLAEESLSLPDPAPPPRQEIGVLERWSSESLRPWLARKSHTVEAARETLDDAAEENHRQRIVAGAVVGLLYEDVGRTLRSVPLPDELEDDPEAAQLFQDVLDGQAAPFLQHARRAYRACAENAVRPKDMRHWSPFCTTRADRLPLPEPVLPPGETEVQVVADRP